jgi:hypothetical protein
MFLSNIRIIRAQVSALLWYAAYSMAAAFILYLSNAMAPRCCGLDDRTLGGAACNSRTTAFAS